MWCSPLLQLRSSFTRTKHSNGSDHFGASVARADNGRDGASGGSTRRQPSGCIVSPAPTQWGVSADTFARAIERGVRHAFGGDPPDPAQLERHLEGPASRRPGARLCVRRGARRRVGALHPRVPAGAVPRGRGDRSLGRRARPGRRALRASSSACHQRDGDAAFALRVLPRPQQPGDLAAGGAGAAPRGPRAGGAGVSRRCPRTSRRRRWRAAAAAIRPTTRDSSRCCARRSRAALGRLDPRGSAAARLLLCPGADAGADRPHAGRARSHRVAAARPGPEDACATTSSGSCARPA